MRKQLEDWSRIKWQKVNKLVKNLRQRIFRARKLGNFKTLRSLQKLMAFSLLLGKKIGVEHSYGWLSVFDADELQEFIKELSEAFRLIDSSTTAWEMIDALIHEWHESATAIASPELAAAFNAETDEVPLTKPSAGSTA